MELDAKLSKEWEKYWEALIIIKLTYNKAVHEHMLQK